jgi:hypothetical protein
MSEMVERVARAICDEEGSSWDDLTEQYGSSCHFLCRESLASHARCRPHRGEGVVDG